MKMIASTISLVNLFRILFSRSPAALKILSDDTDVAGTARTSFATIATCGKRFSVWLHHCRGSASGLIFSARSHLVSPLTSSVEVFSDESYCRKINFRRLAGISKEERRLSSARLRGRSSSRDSRRSSVTLR